MRRWHFILGVGVSLLFAAALLYLPFRPSRVLTEHNTGSVEWVESDWVKEERIKRANYERQLLADQQTRAILEEFAKTGRVPGCGRGSGCAIDILEEAIEANQPHYGHRIEGANK